MSKSVVIFGAGPAGLTAAYFLCKAGFVVTVLEKEAVVGGIARTVAYDNFRFDLGGHRWYSESKKADDFFKEICGSSLLTVPRTTRIYFKGKFYNMPIRPLEILWNINWKISLMVLLDNLFGRPKMPTGEINLEEAYSNQFGETLFKLFFEKYNQKLWGRSCRELSGSWISIRAKGLTLGSMFKGLFVKNVNLEAIDNFYYPKFGIGQFSDFLRERIESLGGKFVFNSPITAIDKNVSGQITSAQTSTAQFTADYYVSSLPLPELTKLLKLDCSNLNFRDLVIVTLFFKKEQVTPDSWVYTQEPTIGFSRFHEPKNWSSAMCPTGTTSLVCEYPCQIEDTTWNKEDSNLINNALSDLSEKMGLVSKEEFLGGLVVRVPKAYPIYTLGYQKAVDASLDEVKSIKNLKTIGRQGTFYYGNMDQPILSGMQVAKEIINDSKS